MGVSIFPRCVNNSPALALDCPSTLQILNFIPLCINSAKDKYLPQAGFLVLFSDFAANMTLTDFTADHKGLILFSVFAAVFIVQLFYYLFFYARLASARLHEKKENDTEPVSVIICARNEEENLRKNLPFFLEQQFHDFEIIVVNDRSYDGSLDYLKEMAEQHPRLKYINIDEDVILAVSKKFALTLGIKKAVHDILLLTDADCKPASPHWIAHIASRFSPDTDVVLGFGAYEKTKFSLLNYFIRFDTFFTALQYFSYSLAGLTYMGVGRNLAYRKHLFFDNKGFGSHNHIRSGDDDLFINETADKANVKISIAQDSHTISDPKKTWSEWFTQKRRHLTTGPLYKTKHKFLLGFFLLSQILFYPLFALLLARSYNIEIASAIFGLRLIIQIIIFRLTMVKLNQRDLLLISPLMDLLLPYITLFLSVSNLIVKPKIWK